MSTFGGLNTAYTGLVAARRGLDVVGQNIVNANVEGYTRQRVTLGSVEAVGNRFSAGAVAGQGVSVTGIARLGDAMLDNQVRSTAGSYGFANVRATSFSRLESSLREPGEGGLSARFDAFAAAWQDVANQPGEAAPAAVLLNEAKALAGRIAAGQDEASGEWSRVRADLDGLVAEVNDAAAGIAELNGQIRKGTAQGVSVNELVDQRDRLAASLAELTGASVRHGEGGMVDVVVDGNSLVAGTKTHALRAEGGSSMSDAAGSPVRVMWADSGRAVATGGEAGGLVSLLASAEDGGPIASAAAQYDALATKLADAVNALHATGTAPDGSTGTDFFAIGTPPATTLTVLPTGAAGIAAGTGGADASVADRIADLFGRPGAADRDWSDFVTTFAAASKAATSSAKVAQTAATNALGAQAAGASVDMDEENINLLMYQQAYQASARVLSAVDEALDTLINRTGVVGR